MFFVSSLLLALALLAEVPPESRAARPGPTTLPDQVPIPVRRPRPRPPRLLVLSDLHLGPDPGGPLDFTTPDSDLSAALAAADPTVLVLDGDIFDLLEVDGPLSLDPPSVQSRLNAVLATPAARNLGHGIQALLARGSRVIVRPGNHDLELHLPEAQKILTQAWPGIVVDTTTPTRVEVAGHRVGIAHGQDADKWNAYNPSAVRARDERAWPAGSHLVKDLLHPLKEQEGLRFLGVLVPDDEAAAFAAICVRPSILGRAAWADTWLTFFPHLLQHRAEAAFGRETPTLPRRFLDAMWRRATQDFEAKAIAGNAAAMELTPSEEEQKRAEELASAWDVDTVVHGHTHAPRQQDLGEGKTYLNSGSWTLRMRIDPDVEDPWGDLLADLREDPEMRGPAVQRRLVLQRTGVLVDADGARAAMWDGERWVNLVDL
jgi:UDP-2,3-diacylglucosamine pyrophosphatase LpxH